VAALDACLATNCAVECNLACGSFAGYVSEPGIASACDACVTGHGDACAAAAACAESVDCDSYTHCRRACVTGDCIGACGPPPVDTTVFSPAYSLVEKYCATECRVGDQWYCAGHFTWPTALSATRRFTFSLTDALGTGPIAGAEVKLCDPGNTRCDPAIDHGTTDASGSATLTDNTTINGNNLGLDGYIDVSSQHDVMGLSLFPTIIYWGFPLSEANGRLGEPIPLFSAAGLAGLTQFNGLSLRADRGHVAVVALDCFGYQAAGVTFSLVASDGSTMSPFYVAGTALSSTGGTDGTGSAFFLNVPPNDATVSAMPSGATVAASTQRVNVRAGILTEVSMAPTAPTR
jgi:hypothetical protein